MPGECVSRSWMTGTSEVMDDRDIRARTSEAVSSSAGGTLLSTERSSNQCLSLCNTSARAWSKLSGRKTRSRCLNGSDQKLVEMAQAGDLRAFDELVARHQARVYALARRILGNAEDAADVQQETFVRAWKSLPKFRLDSELGTWLHRITVNLCLTRKRRKEPISATEFNEDIRVGDGGRTWEGEAPAEPSAVVTIERTEMMRAVRGVISLMPAHYRVVLVLRDIEDRPFAEIARILDCSEQSARVRATRARQMLRERMRPYLEGTE